MCLTNRYHIRRVKKCANLDLMINCPLFCLTKITVQHGLFFVI